MRPTEPGMELGPFEHRVVGHENHVIECGPWSLCMVTFDMGPEDVETVCIPPEDAAKICAILNKYTWVAGDE